TREDLQCARAYDGRGMRSTAPGLRPRDETATIHVDGQPRECRVGDTVAAALVDAGQLTCRVTRQGGPRGIFCGMGVCHDCVMLVDGVPLRTCMTPVRDGMQVEVEADARPPQTLEVQLEHVVLAPKVLV